MNNNWIIVKNETHSSVIKFYRNFHLDDNDGVSLNITSLGLYKVFVNGKEISKKIFTPGLTSYDFRLMYQTYDISTFCVKGRNLIEIYVAPGWAIGTYGLYNTKNWMGDKIALNLEIIHNNQIILISDTSFKAESSFILFSDIYDGEVQDYRLNDFEEYQVDKLEKNLNLVPNEGEDVLEQEIVKPVNLIISPKGEKIIDFGQNLAGYISLLEPDSGIYRFNFAEVLDKDGNFYNENYRGIKNIVEFNIGDKKITTAKPWFSFQGFRYALIEHWPENVEINLNKIQAIVIFSNIKRSSYFKCQNSKINQLYSNIIWGQKGNFIDIPTDCPQRDERLGWLGDAEVFARTACYNFKCDKFFDKWLKDVELEQGSDGAIKGFVPHVLRDNCDVSCGWGDACVIIPFELYEAYGNKDILKKYLPMMKRWVEYMHHSGPVEYLWIGHFSFGDWLALDLPAGNYVGATQKDFISSAYFYKTTKMVSDIISILGEDNSYYENLAKNIKLAFRDYFMKDGLPILNYTHHAFDPHKPDVAVTQTSLSILLTFGLYDSDIEKALEAKTLNELVVKNSYKLTTGFLGTPILLSSLSDNGYIKTAVELLLQEEFPSWLYSVNRGATTIWEHWDSVNEKGEFWSSDMNSFNHYSYGAVLSWIIENIVGLKRLEPGYKKISIKPYFDERFGNVSFSINTESGLINISVRSENGNVITDYDVGKDIKIVD